MLAKVVGGFGQFWRVEKGCKISCSTGGLLLSEFQSVSVDGCEKDGMHLAVSVSVLFSKSWRSLWSPWAAGTRLTSGRRMCSPSSTVRSLHMHVLLLSWLLLLQIGLLFQYLSMRGTHSRKTWAKLWAASHSGPVEQQASIKINTYTSPCPATTLAHLL